MPISIQTTKLCIFGLKNVDLVKIENFIDFAYKNNTNNYIRKRSKFRVCVVSLSALIF